MAKVSQLGLRVCKNFGVEFAFTKWTARFKSLN